MDENPYRSPECCDQQEQPPEPQQPYYGIPDWVFATVAVLAVIGIIVALLMPAVQ